MLSLRALFLACIAVIWCHPAFATPAFARKQQLGCPVCHTAFPELNAVGRQYKEHGYRFPDSVTEALKTTGTDVGSGIILDPFPGIALRVKSVPLVVSPDATGNEAITGAPIDSAELIMAGSNGDHWSYLAEMGAEASGGYAVEANAVVMYHVDHALTAYVGWTPMFSRDAYNSLSESRRVDSVEHAVQDYTGSTGINMNTEGGVIGLYGRVGRFFYLAETGPGPDAPFVGDEPFDYVGRAAVDINKNISVGGFVYYGATSADSTVRPGVDINAVTTAGTFKVVGMYDTTDAAVLAEAGWDLAQQMKGYWIIPQAHLDVTSAGGATTVTPMVGIGIQQSSGRVQVEVWDPLGGSTFVGPTGQLKIDVVF